MSVAYPIILGLDWLHQHNPNIDWEDSTLSFKCCGLTRMNPIIVMAKGFGLKLKLLPSRLNVLAAVGIGFGLSDAASHSAHILLPMAASGVESPAPIPEPDLAHPKTSFLASFMSWSGYGHSNPLATPSIAPIASNICFVSVKKF
jgi:hypothetical protein